MLVQIALRSPSCNLFFSCFWHVMQFCCAIVGSGISWKAFSSCELTFASPSVINRANVGQSGMGDGQQGIGYSRLSSILLILSRHSRCLTCLDWRDDREADLSTEQAGAQTAPWFSCPYGYQRWPEGNCRSARARSQAPVGLISGARWAHR